MILLLLIVCFLPVILSGLYIYKKDSEKEPKSLLIELFVSGLFAAIIVIIANLFIALIIPEMYLSNTSNKYNSYMLFILIFIEVALLEELTKWIMVKTIGYKNKNFDQLYDIIVYSVFVALGFAAYENIFYVLQGGVEIGLYRAIFSVPGHASFGVFMGYYLGLAKINENKNKKEYIKNILLSIFIPTLLHTIYNFCLMTENLSFQLIFLGFIIILYVSALLKIDQLSKIKGTLNK